jgi:hypothetical protein
MLYGWNASNKSEPGSDKRMKNQRDLRKKNDKPKGHALKRVRLLLKIELGAVQVSERQNRRCPRISILLNAPAVAKTKIDTDIFDRRFTKRGWPPTLLLLETIATLQNWRQASMNSHIKLN